MRIKKIIIPILLIVFLVTTLLSFTACAKTVKKDAFELLSTAITGSESAPFYYYKEQRLDSNYTKILKVNLIGDIDKNFVPIRKDGLINNYKLHIVDSQIKVGTTAETIQEEIFIGKIKDNKNYLLSQKNENGQYKKEVKELSELGDIHSIEDFIQSDEYFPFSINAKLSEIKGLKKEDITLDKVTQMRKVYTVKFSVTDEYLAAYKEENGRDSIFKGSTRVEIEIAYSRISAITVFVSEGEGQSLINIEKEPYKLSITYRGPKIELPKISKNSNNEYTW